MSECIYLDHNATSPMLPEVADAVREASLKYGGNPASQHAAGREAKLALEDARQRIGELLGARPSDRVVLTSGGTEANNLAVQGLRTSSHLRESLPGQQPDLIISAIEHPSVQEPARQLEMKGWRVTRLDVNSQGIVCVEQAEQALRENVRLASLMLANNETGVVQPVAEMAKRCESHGVPLHTDASQVVGKLPVNFTQLNVAALSCAAHKFNGPLGIGALIVRHDVSIHPSLYGGNQQAEIRPGTESVALAVGMCTALKCFCREAEVRALRLARLRDDLESVVQHELPWALIIGGGAKRLPNTSNIAFLGIDRQALVMALDLEGVACSTGSACASGSSEPSPTLVAMGLSNNIIEGAVRFSFGTCTTAAELSEATRRIIKVCKRLRNRGNR